MELIESSEFNMDFSKKSRAKTTSRQLSAFSSDKPVGVRHIICRSYREERSDVAIS